MLTRPWWNCWIERASVPQQSDMLSPRRRVLVPRVKQWCESGFPHRGPWEEFRKLTREDELRMEQEKDSQRMQLLRMAGLTTADWFAQGLTLGIDHRLEFVGPSTHRRCGWCGHEEVLRFFIRAFEPLDMPIRPMNTFTSFLTI